MKFNLQSQSQKPTLTGPALHLQVLSFEGAGLLLAGCVGLGAAPAKLDDPTPCHETFDQHHSSLST